MKTQISYNQIYADTQRVFRRACELAGTPPTRRQASKYQKGRGKASMFRHEAIRSLQDEGHTVLSLDGQG